MHCWGCNGHIVPHAVLEAELGSRWLVDNDNISVHLISIDDIDIWWYCAMPRLSEAAADEYIGATTVGTGREWSPPTFTLGDQQRIGPPNFLAVVFKKQEISQQVLLLMSAEATRMQDLVSEFSKKFSGGNTPGPQQLELRPPPTLIPSPASDRACWDPNLGPPQLFSRGCAPGCISNWHVTVVVMCFSCINARRLSYSRLHGYWTRQRCKVYRTSQVQRYCTCFT